MTLLPASKIYKLPDSAIPPPFLLGVGELLHESELHVVSVE